MKIILLMLLQLFIQKQIDIYFDYNYITDNLFDKKEFIQYVLEDWVKEKIHSFLELKSETQFQIPQKFDCDSITELKNFPEKLNPDLVIIILLENTQSFIASSKTCLYHQDSKRPILGVIKLSIIRFQIFAENSFYAANTLLHEVIHVLGFSKKNFEQNPKGPSSFFNNNQIIFSQIAEIARKHFNCSNVGGIKIENEGSSSSSGNHFEFQQLGNELMNPQFSTSLVLSEFSASVLQQTGFYEINFDKTEPLIWGLNQGCNFLNSCKQEFLEYCDNPKQIVCSQDFASKAICEKTNFSNGCLVKNEQIGYSCRRNYDLIKTVQFEESGKYSRCFQTENNGEKNAGCFKAKCKINQNIVEVKIGDSWFECDSSSKNFLIQGQKVYCPDPIIFCQRSRLDECDDDCNGKGQCLKDGSCFCDYFYGGDSCTKFQDCQKGSSYLCSQLKKTFHGNQFSKIRVLLKFLIPGILINFQ